LGAPTRDSAARLTAAARQKHDFVTASSTALFTLRTAGTPDGKARLWRVPAASGIPPGGDRLCGARRIFAHAWAGLACAGWRPIRPMAFSASHAGTDFHDRSPVNLRWEPRMAFAPRPPRSNFQPDQAHGRFTAVNGINLTIPRGGDGLRPQRRQKIRRCGSSRGSCC
jgi:hypothetical protein